MNHKLETVKTLYTMHKESDIFIECDCFFFKYQLALHDTCSVTLYEQVYSYCQQTYFTITSDFCPFFTIDLFKFVFPPFLSCFFGFIFTSGLCISMTSINACEIKWERNLNQIESFALGIQQMKWIKEFSSRKIL